MPPKKKVKEAEVPQQMQPEPQQQQQQVFRIPKKPFYRKVYFDSHEKEKPIQIKLWKINSLKVPYIFNFRPQSVYQLSKKRVFKNLRELDYSYFPTYKLKKSNELLSKSWRLEKFTFSGFEREPIKMKKFITKRMNPHLKDFFWKERIPYESYFGKFIDGWRSFVDCKISFGRGFPVLVLNTKKIRSLERFLKGSNKNQVIESVETFYVDIVDEDIVYGAIFDLSSVDASQFPNLKAIEVSPSVSNSMEKLDFIKKYPQITTLSLEDASSFEFLSTLSNLKQLTIHSEEAQEKPNILPIIDSLEKLDISCSPEKFSAENLQEFFVSNKDLKSLSVQFPLRDDYLIFHENLILPIETLKLTISAADSNHSRKTIIKKLTAFLSQNQQIRSLEIHLLRGFPIDQSEILQKGVSSLTGLEHLAWTHRMPTELQDIQLKDFKNIFIQNSGIQKVELQFGPGLLYSRSASSFIDGLLSLKKLKYLSLGIGFYRISPSTLGKFLELLRFLVFGNAATVKLALQGVAQEEIDPVIAQKHPLWKIDSKCR